MSQSQINNFQSMSLKGLNTKKKDPPFFFYSCKIIAKSTKQIIEGENIECHRLGFLLSICAKTPIPLFLLKTLKTYISLSFSSCSMRLHQQPALRPEDTTSNQPEFTGLSPLCGVHSSTSRLITSFAG